MDSHEDVRSLVWHQRGPSNHHHVKSTWSMDGRLNGTLTRVCSRTGGNRGGAARGSAAWVVYDNRGGARRWEGL